MPEIAQYESIINNKPIHIATVTPDNRPNLAVASDVQIYENDRIIISVNEMAHTQENLRHNPEVVLTAFDKDWKGVRIFGRAKFYANGKYYDFCEKTFFGNGEVSPFGATKPKGAILVKIDRLESYV